MEMNEWLILGLCVVVSNVVIGTLVGLLLRYLSDHSVTFRLASIEKKIESITKTEYSSRGVAAREQKAERQSEALAALAQEMAKGTPQMDAIKKVAAAYPDVALSLGSKLLQGKLGL